MKRLASRIRDPRSVRVINGVIFYLGWFAAVAGAVGGWPGRGAALLWLLLLFHLAITAGRLKETLLIAVIMAMGFVIDSIFITWGVIEVVSPNTIDPRLSPLRLASLYALYATTIDHSLKWLGMHPVVAIWAGGLGGATCYAIGARMGACSFPLPHGRSILIIAAVWALFAPISFAISRWLDRRLAR